MSHGTSLPIRYPYPASHQVLTAHRRIDWKQSLRSCITFPVCAAYLFACMVYLWIPMTVDDPDVWWHLRNAEILVRTHTFIRADHFSFTAFGAPWINHEWLAELPFYLGWRVWGPRGITCVTTALIEGILLGVFYLCYKRSRSIVATIVASVFAALLSTVSFGPRTLLFGWLCLVVELWLLDAIERGRRLEWALPCLFAVWVNLHGSWLIGFILLVVYTACSYCSVDQGIVYSERWTCAKSLRLTGFSFLSLGALFINPYTWRLVWYPFDLAFRQTLNISTIDEWKTLDFHATRGKVFLVVLLLFVGLLLLKQSRWLLNEVAFFLIGTYAALTYSRFLFLAAILFAPILARHLSHVGRPRAFRSIGWLNLALVGATIPLLLQHLPRALDQSSGNVQLSNAAVAAVQHLQHGDRLFNDFKWGGVLEMRAPAVPVFIDSRVDIFEYNGTFRDYLQAVSLQETYQVFAKYGITHVLFSRNTALAYLLERSSDWTLAYQDHDVDLFVKRGLRTAGRAQ